MNSASPICRSMYKSVRKNFEFHLDLSNKSKSLHKFTRRAVVDNVRCWTGGWFTVWVMEQLGGNCLKLLFLSLNICCTRVQALFKELDMRQCEIKDIKFYQARTKIIALGWYWVTMIFFGQMNPKIHCSPGMHNVQVITKNYCTNQWKRLEN